MNKIKKWISKKYTKEEYKRALKIFAIVMNIIVFALNATKFKFYKGSLLQVIIEVLVILLLFAASSTISYLVLCLPYFLRDSFFNKRNNNEDDNQ